MDKHIFENDPWFWRAFYQTAEFAGYAYDTGSLPCEECAKIAMEIAKKMVDTYYEDGNYWEDAEAVMYAELDEHFEKREN